MRTIIATGPRWSDALTDRRGEGVRLAAALTLYKTRVGYQDRAGDETQIMVQGSGETIDSFFKDIPGRNVIYPPQFVSFLPPGIDEQIVQLSEWVKMRDGKIDLVWIMANRFNHADLTKRLRNEKYKHLNHQVILAEEVLLGHDAAKWKEVVDNMREK